MGGEADPVRALSDLGIFVVAAICEIAGCFSFWAWSRLEASVWWLLPGLVSLIVFAWSLTRVDADFAGRAYAAYGGIYIVTSLAWLWAAEGQRPDRWDVAGAGLCVIGAAVILWGRRVS